MRITMLGKGGRRIWTRIWIWGAVGGVLAACSPSSTAADRLSYNRDIRPILSENCFGCHGPDEHDRKGALETTMDAGAKGVKIQLAGRLGGAEMSRCEKAIAGAMPLSTLRAKIDYGFCEAPTAQGNIGIQVWVNQGMYEEDGDGADAQEGQAPKKPKRSYKR